ncbi:putative thioredoxin-2 [Porphyridium purpureum]|uniref:Putative thioredoxin-2 n=1 Tax=Porphyridium purpureum TaxID=35688 RepID=A0A5J4Z9J7_PORPP|nr:putative thioredoxin-2 [Porphyridium purpureum]|eukprot:POR4208..scf295_1
MAVTALMRLRVLARAPLGNASSFGVSVRRMCQSAWAPGTVVMDIEPEQFKTHVLEELKVPVLLQAHATWCAPCRKFTPVLEEAVLAHQGRIKLARLDVDKAMEIARSLDVSTVPAVFLFHKGEKKGGFVGSMDTGGTTNYIEDAIRMCSK